MNLRNVNMTDINFSGLPADRNPAESSAPGSTSEFRWDIIELLFFAYRDFVGDADQVLEAFGLVGRTTGSCISSTVTPD